MTSLPPSRRALSGTASLPTTGTVALNRGLDICEAIAKTILHAVDNGLGRIDFAVTQDPGVAALPFGILRPRERILPPEVIPIADGKAQRDDVGPLSKLIEELIGFRTGGASLARIKLDHRGVFGRTISRCLG